MATPSTYPTWPQPGDEEIAAAERVLRSGKLNYWTGDEGRQFEAEFAKFVGVKHAVAVANGTVALELALYALGVGAGDEVIVPSRTFIATASAVVARGAKPVVADVDRDSQTMTADTMRPCLSPRTRAIITVHLGGWPCEMDGILRTARRLGLKVIEDCAQAHGARYRGRPVGSFGHAAAFSFCQDKILTTAGEGGMLVTNRDDVFERAWSFKDHGKNHAAAHAPPSTPGFRWLHDSFGTNWRLTEVQSAIGRAALRQLPAWVEVRRRHAALLAARLADLPALRVPQPGAEGFHAYYKLYVFVKRERMRRDWSRDRVLAEITAAGVPCGTGACPEIYLENAFPPEWRPARRRPVARELGETSLMFLVHPTLSAEHVEEFAEVIREVVSRATAPAAERQPRRRSA
jgi:dTDP-4-amino-4,6-dideoxygalactose transaminase